jgi:hypothetical protein
MDLADVVEHTCEGKSLQVILAEPDTAAQVNRKVGDPMNVPVQVLDDVFHHLDEKIVGKLSHTNTTGVSLPGTSPLVDKSIVSFITESDFGREE